MKRRWLPGIGSSCDDTVRYPSRMMKIGTRSQLIQKRTPGLQKRSDAAVCGSGLGSGLPDNPRTIRQQIPAVIQNVACTKNTPLPANPGKACTKAPATATQRITRNNNWPRPNSLEGAKGKSCRCNRTIATNIPAESISPTRRNHHSVRTPKR
ncbi:hypothetical protein ES707_12933 [subsurface metagenome]